MTAVQRKVVYAFALFIGGLALLLFFLSAITDTQAGELGVYACPTTDPDVTHYQIHTGDALLARVPRDELISAAGLVGGIDSPCPGAALMGYVLSGVPDDCTPRTYTARFTVGEVQSRDSSPVTSIARPYVEWVGVADTGIRQVVGQNFIPGTSVTKPDGTPIATVHRTCQVLDITDTVTRQIVVTTPNGLLPFEFTIPVDRPEEPTAH
jgi:hypothetical protein